MNDRENRDGCKRSHHCHGCAVQHLRYDESIYPYKNNRPKQHLPMRRPSKLFRHCEVSERVSERACVVCDE